MSMDFRDLVKVGAHFGHLKARLNPRMKPYIWGVKNNVHLIDVSKTAVLADKAAKFLESVVAEGKPILWVGTKKPAKEVIYNVASKLGMPYVNHRWIGGTLSNFSQVKKSVTKLLHYEDVLAKKEKFPHYTKKELSIIAKVVERLKKNIGGIRGLKWPIGAVVLVDVAKEMSALKEAATVGIPIVGVVDTNGDPSLVDYVIPANDDSVRSIKLIVDYLGDASEKGQKAVEAAKAAKKVEAEAKRTLRQGSAEQRRSAQEDRKGGKAADKKARPVAKKAEVKPAAKKTETKKPAAKADTKKKTEVKKPAVKAEAKKKAPEKVEKKPAAKETEVPKTKEKKTEAKKEEANK